MRGGEGEAMLRWRAEGGGVFDEERVCMGGEGKGGVGCFTTGMLWERRGGEGRDGVFEKDRNAVGRLNSFSLWMWCEYTHDLLHCAAARQERSLCNMHRGDEKGP